MSPYDPLDNRRTMCYTVGIMKKHLVRCVACGKKWWISDYFLDDGNEIACPFCGCRAYEKETDEDVEGYAPLSRPLEGT